MGRLMKTLNRWLAAGLALGAAFVVISVAAAGSAKGPIVNPDAGRSDADRAATYATMRAEFDARYATWMASLNTSQIDFSALPHAELNAQVVPGEPTLGTAVGHADRIIIGRVVSLQPTINGTLVAVRVERTMKGEASATIVIRQSSGLRPTADWR